MSGDELRANPYVGLRPFFIEDSLYFYGREQQTAELLNILRQHRFLSVVGSSGSGKSSLVRAGLLPGLIGGFLVQDRDRWSTVQVKPGDSPIGNLASGLVKAMQRPAEEAASLEQKIRDDHTDAVVEFLRARIDERTNVFILVDQFEEIFAFRGGDEDADSSATDPERRKERARRRAEAADFVHLLLGLTERQELPIYVSLTMRTDFLGECDLFYGLPEALNRGRYLVPRLTREQLRDAIECPALLLGAEVAPRLLDYVLNELGDRTDRLPVLQHAVLRTWDAWEGSGRMGPIDIAHFRLAGGLEGALNKDAESALTGVDRDAAARVFKRLTDTDAGQRRVRSPARVSELMASSGADRQTVDGIVEQFRKDGRSFVHASADGVPDDPRIDISHESLIRQWDSLRTWVDEERASRDTYREVLARARKKADDKASLLQDPELKIVFDWRSNERPSPGWARRYSGVDEDFASTNAYLDESVKARARDLAELELGRRWRRTWAPAIAVMAVGLFVWFAPKSPFERTPAAVTEPSAAAAESPTVRLMELAWTKNDFGKTLTWQAADAACRALEIPVNADGAAQSGWRLPSATELVDIYSPDQQGRKVIRPFQQGVHFDYLWSLDRASTTSGKPRRIAADFRNALTVPLFEDVGDTAAALCVVGAEASETTVAIEQGRWNSARFDEREDYWRSLSSALGYVGALLLIYYALSLLARRLQRRLSFDAMVARFVAAGGRNPDEAKLTAPRVDAVIAHDTVYAPTFRRIGGWVIDQVIFLPVFVGLMIFMLGGEPRVTIRMPDGELVEGTLLDWTGPELDLQTDADGRRVISMLPPSGVTFVEDGAPKPVQTTLPSGTIARGRSFASRLVRAVENGEEWYGTFDEENSQGDTVSLKYTNALWQKSKDAFVADLRWRFGAKDDLVTSELTKWEQANPAPNGIEQRRYSLTGPELIRTDYPPSNRAVWLFLIGMLASNWLYETLQVASNRRATIGMRAAGLMRTDLHGEKLSFGRASALWLCRLGSYLAFGLGFVVQPFTKRHQTVHDRVAGSVVLQRPRPGARPAIVPAKRSILRSMLKAAAAVVLLLMVAVIVLLLSPPGYQVAMGTDPGSSTFNAWSAWTWPWDEVGVELRPEQVSLNGEPVQPSDRERPREFDPPPIDAKLGEPVKVEITGTLDVVPPLRCIKHECLVALQYGTVYLGDTPDADMPDRVTIASSKCDAPAVRASGDKRQEPFSLDVALPAQTKPGLYGLWVDFAKLAPCEVGAVPGTQNTWWLMAKFEVK